MLVKFISSETGEMVMMAEVARPLLQAIGKRCDAQGVITQEEMLSAAAALESHVAEASVAEVLPSEEDEADIPPMARAVGMRQRAWPLINMLQRTARARKASHILWEAAADFELEPEN